MSYSDQVSAKIPLVENEYYYIEAQNWVGNGNEHLSVAVEIEQTEIDNHPSSVKEVQRLQVN